MPSPPATLHLCFGEAHEDLLSHHQVFAEHRFALRDGQATLYVIGASSIVLVEAMGVRLAEMIVCGPSRGGFRPSCEAGLSLHVGSEGRIVHQTSGVRYSAEVRATDLSRPRSSRPHSSDVVPGAYERVSYHFPFAGHPLTEIQAAEVEPGRLIVRTVHEYPEHGVRVLSRSRWDFATGC
jgi:hypothetical protein